MHPHSRLMHTLMQTCAIRRQIVDNARNIFHSGEECNKPGGHTQQKTTRESFGIDKPKNVFYDLRALSVPKNNLLYLLPS